MDIKGTAAPTLFPPQWETPHPVKVGWMRQFRYFARLFDRIATVAGDVVECGVGMGTTFVMLAYLAGSDRRRLRGFDSFAGFPEPTEHDRSWRNPQAGEWKVNPEDIWNRLRESGIPDEFPDLSITISPGLLAEMLPKEPPYEIAFLHLDVDLYASYRDGLQYLFPRVVPGGIVLFDEYREYSSQHPNEEKWPGATKAIDEYLKPLGYTLNYYPETRKYFVVK